MKIKLFILTALAILLIPVSVKASSFYIRLNQPKSPTNQNNFELSFTASDTKDNRSITVRCYKKGPSDSDFTQFDTNQIVSPGGNSDKFCNVTNSILSSNGVYSFYVTGEVPSESLFTSSTVTVEYNTSGPSTPVSYSKERVNSCDYKIKFRTANDGKTTKVQLFRSDTLSISIDSSNAITTLSIGPDQEGTITNSVPDCSKNYYYVIRAVDSSDNVSGTIGDSFTTTTTTTTTGTTGTTGTSGTGGAIALSGASTQVTDGTTGTPSGTSDDGSSVTGTPSPEILGSSTDTKWTFKKWIVLLVIAFVIYFVLNFVKRVRSK